VKVDEPSVSAEHAAIFWDGATWCARDLGSTNGTFVDGQKLAPGERRALAEGAVIDLGGSGERWALADALPPVASARSEGGLVRVAEDGLLALPDAESPAAIVFEDEDERWQLEIDGEARAARDGERVIAGSAWTLSVPPEPGGALPPTRDLRKDGRVLGAITLCFSVSRDEEHVELSIAIGGRSEPLGARAHNYLLLTLARARLGDRDALPPAERGWLYVDDLLGKLALDPQQLNLHIFRARQQLAQAGVRDGGSLFERRSGSRQIRLGTDRIIVTPTGST
jgi:hypothetical protein